MSRVLVSQRLVKQEVYGEIRACLDESWGDFFQDAGVVPIPVLTTTPAKDIWSTLSPSLLVLTGGNDLSRFSNDPLSKMRDELERQHLEQAIAQNVPVLGFCRGAQFIADYFGAKLGPIRGHVATRHPLTFSSDTSFGSLGVNGREVNSYHAYGVLDAGSELKNIAAAPDGSIEAFEHKLHAIVGMMWHPEREPAIERVLERNILAGMLKKGS